MRAIVFGAGGVGGVIAGYLARAGRDVVVVDPWYQHVEVIRAQGLRVQAIEEEFTTRVDVRHVDELSGLGRADIVVVAMKSYDTYWVSAALARHIATDGCAVSAQNGINEPILETVFGPERTVGCVVAMAVELVDRGHVKRTSGEEWGTLTFGELHGGAGDRVDRLVEFFEPMGGVAASDSIESEMWGKLGLNVMSNALGGVTGFTTTHLWADPEVVAIGVALGHETAKVARAIGVRPSPALKTITHEVLEGATSVKTAAWAEVRDRMFEAAATRTGARENTPSLLQDVRKGRRTEIDHLNGLVLAEAKRHGVAAPMNAAIVEVVHEIDRGERRPTKANLAPLLSVLEREYEGGPV